MKANVDARSACEQEQQFAGDDDGFHFAFDWFALSGLDTDSRQRPCMIVRGIDLGNTP
jgi:hypothetical protein